MIKKVVSSPRKHSHPGSVRIIATNADYAKLCKKLLKRLPSGLNAKVEFLPFTSPKEGHSTPTQVDLTLFVSRFSDISTADHNLPSTGASSKQLLFLERLPIEAVAARLLMLNIRNPHRLHIAADRDNKSIEDLVYRAVSGVGQNDDSQPIVDAWIENEQLVLLSPGFHRLDIPLVKLARSIGTNPSQINSFQIDEDGRYLFWPHADAHLGWTQFRQIVDPTAGLKAIQQTMEFNVRYGSAIRMVRERQGLKQTDIPGVTERHLRRVEHGLQRASTATLKALAASHGKPLEGYLSSLAECMVR